MWMDGVMWSKGRGWKHGKLQGRGWMGGARGGGGGGELDGIVAVGGRQEMDGTEWGGK